MDTFGNHIYNTYQHHLDNSREYNCTTFTSLCSAVIIIVQCNHFHEKLHPCHHKKLHLHHYDLHHYQHYPDAPVGQHCYKVSQVLIIVRFMMIMIIFAFLIVAGLIRVIKNNSNVYLNVSQSNFQTDQIMMIFGNLLALL